MKIGNLGTQDKSNSYEQAGKVNGGNFESRLKKAMDEKDEKVLKSTCKEFESIFMKVIYKQMKSTVMKSGFMPDSNAKEMFDSMLDDKLADESSKAGGLGLGEMLFKQLKKDMSRKYKVQD